MKDIPQIKIALKSIIDTPYIMSAMMRARRLSKESFNAAKDAASAAKSAAYAGEKVMTKPIFNAMNSLSEYLSKYNLSTGRLKDKVAEKAESETENCALVETEDSHVIQLNVVAVTPCESGSVTPQHEPVEEEVEAPFEKLIAGAVEVVNEAVNDWATELVARVATETSTGDQEPAASTNIVESAFESPGIFTPPPPPLVESAFESFTVTPPPPLLPALVEVGIIKHGVPWRGSYHRKLVVGKGKVCTRRLYPLPSVILSHTPSMALALRCPPHVLALSSHLGLTSLGRHPRPRDAAQDQRMAQPSRVFPPTQDLCPPTQGRPERRRRDDCAEHCAVAGGARVAAPEVPLLRRQRGRARGNSQGAGQPRRCADVVVTRRLCELVDRPLAVWATEGRILSWRVIMATLGPGPSGWRVSLEERR